ncbi:hypothetical protein TNCV_1893341 [Trichonephila clavipes]|nr:hypothetical protein TNCV_1893341 [Trichonephila clavipes]
MARNKKSVNNSRKGITNSTSPERTFSTGMLTLACMDNRQPSTSGSNPSLSHSAYSCMDLSLPASTQSSRPGTPQGYVNRSLSNCQGLLKLTNNIKAYSTSIDGCHKCINDLIQASLTDPNNPIMVENTRVLEALNERNQQTVSEFTSHPAPSPMRNP